MLAHHLMDHPIDMCYDESRRLLHLAMTNGTVATLTVYRDEEVSGWTQQQTDGHVLAITNVGEDVFLLVEREGTVFIEVFDETLNVDCGLAGTSVTPKQEWSGASHLEGRRVKVLADGAVVGDKDVQGGIVRLDEPALSVQLGLPFTHTIQPLPPAAVSLSGSSGGRFRPISLTLRVLDTKALYLDSGRGLMYVPFRRFSEGLLGAPLEAYSGDVTVRTLGWRDTGIDPIWRIEQDVPLPFTLLSVSMEISVSG